MSLSERCRYKGSPHSWRAGSVANHTKRTAGVVSSPLVRLPQGGPFPHRLRDQPNPLPGSLDVAAMSCEGQWLRALFVSFITLWIFPVS